MNLVGWMYLLGLISLVLAPFTGITVVTAAAFFLIGYIASRATQTESPAGDQASHARQQWDEANPGHRPLLNATSSDVYAQHAAAPSSGAAAKLASILKDREQQMASALSRFTITDNDTQQINQIIKAISDHADKDGELQYRWHAVMPVMRLYLLTITPDKQVFYEGLILRALARDWVLRSGFTSWISAVKRDLAEDSKWFPLFMIQIGAFRGKINTLKDAQFEPSHAADEITELLMQISYSLKPLKSYRSEPYFDYGLIMLGGEILEIQTWSGKRGWQDIYRSVELVSHKISIV